MSVTSNFNVNDYGISSIGSYECGKSVHYEICGYAFSGKYTVGDGTGSEPDAGYLGDNTWVTLEAK